MDDRSLNKINHIFIILIFCTAIYVPFLTGIVERDVDVSEIEKRKLAELPAAPRSINEINCYPGLFDQYYSDHFGLRFWFSNYYSLAKYCLRESTTENVTFSDDGWMFLGSIKTPVYEDPIGDARHLNHFTQQELKDFARHLTGLDTWLKARNIQYIFVIAPNKHTIYFDKLPRYIQKMHPQSPTDQLVDYLNEHTEVAVVDLRDALIREKDNQPLYSSTGTHWNFMGGNIAQYEIMRKIEKMFPGRIQPERYDDSIFEFDTATDRDLEQIAGIELNPPPVAPFPVFTPGEKSILNYPKEIHTLVNRSQNLNAVVFRDSFFKVLEPYFLRKFKSSTYIWEQITYPRLKEQVELHQPDIVIEEWVERILPHVPQRNPEFDKYYQQYLFDQSHQQILTIDQKQLHLNNSLKILEKQPGLTRLKTIGKSPVITLPEIPGKQPGASILRIKLYSSAPTSMQVLPLLQTGQNSSHQRDLSFPHLINKGENVFFIPLESTGVKCCLHLQTQSEPNEITIQSLDLKQVSHEERSHENQ